MSVLAFESEEALRFAITSGLVPENVVTASAKTWRDDEGVIYVAPDPAVAPDAMKKLAKAGVKREKANHSSPSATTVRCWAEIVSVKKVREPEADIGQVLFVLPEDGSLCDLAGELIRLGCDRFEWRSRGDEHVIRAPAPPYYSLVRAMDQMAGIRAFIPSPPGQDRVYVEIGWEHPLASFLRPDPGQTLLVQGPAKRTGAAPTTIGSGPASVRNGQMYSEPSFTLLAEGSFSDAYALLDLRTPGDDKNKTEHEPTEVAPTLKVTLKLSRAASVEAPSLWVIRDDAVKRTERLLAGLPEEISRSLLFAACGADGEEMVVLRTRPGTKTTVEVDGEAYRPHPAISNLFLPVEATLEPPLRRDRIGALLAAEPDVIVWLRPLQGGSFQVERLADESFQPLSEWVEYVIDTNASKLEPWVRSATFDFDAFVGAEPIVERIRRASDDDDDDEPKKKKKSSREAAPEPVQTRTARTARRAPVESEPQMPTLVAAEVETAPAAEALADLEKEFIESDAPADDPARRELWERMAPLAARLNRHQDATMAWARAVWDLTPDEAAPKAKAWASAMSGPVFKASASSILAIEDPSADHARALAAILISEADDALKSRAHDASLWFDRHDASLDLRTAWLARVAIGRLVGGDRLGLARARDRLLARIHGGLSLERDVPSFLRRAGGSRDAAQVELLSGKLEALLARFGSAKRKRSATEADPKLTAAYVGFVFAYGAARLGRVDWARKLRQQSLGALDQNDAVHGFLARAYAARVDHALEGLPPETPLPADVSARLNALAKLDRYKVDRLRQCSKVLEPHERLDPIAAFQRGEADPRGPEFAPLRGATDMEVVSKGVVGIMNKAKSAPVEERARLYDGVMDFFPQLAQEVALGHLETLISSINDVPATRKAQLLEEALMLAGHFGEERLARKIFAVLEPLIAGVSPDSAAEIAPLVGGMLRTLRRVGLKDEASRLLVAVQSAAKGKATPHLVARLHAAAGLAYLGEMDRAKPTFEEALAVLAGDLLTPERLVLTRALARALGAAPIQFAVAGLDTLQKKLEIITDSFNTNSHVCLSVVDFMEALVLGYASEDLVIGHAARRWLDDDEYLVRRRIHKDMGR